MCKSFAFSDLTNWVYHQKYEETAQNITPCSLCHIDNVQNGKPLSLLFSVKVSSISSSLEKQYQMSLMTIKIYLDSVSKTARYLIKPLECLIIYTFSHSFCHCICERKPCFVLILFLRSFWLMTWYYFSFQCYMGSHSKLL